MVNVNILKTAASGVLLFMLLCTSGFAGDPPGEKADSDWLKPSSLKKKSALNINSSLRGKIVNPEFADGYHAVNANTFSGDDLSYTFQIEIEADNAINNLKAFVYDNEDHGTGDDYDKPVFSVNGGVNTISVEEEFHSASSQQDPIRLQLLVRSYEIDPQDDTPPEELYSQDFEGVFFLSSPLYLLIYETCDDGYDQNDECLTDDCSDTNQNSICDKYECEDSDGDNTCDTCTDSDGNMFCDYYEN